MKCEHSCGAVIFTREGGGIRYVIIESIEGIFGFPKGHMEAGETETQTALRELLEETGLRAELIPGERTVLEYHIPPYTRKQVVLFSGRVEGTVILQQTEAVRWRWAKAHELRDYLHPDTYAAFVKGRSAATVG